MSLTNRLPARFTLAHGLMILAGLMTFLLVNTTLASNRATERVVFAGVDSAAGRSVRPVFREVPADTPGLELWATENDLMGRVFERQMTAGEPIMKSDLVDPGQVGFKTFAIAVKDFEIDGLDLRTRDRVDVIGFDDDDRSEFLAIGLVVAGTSATSNDGLGGSSDSYITVQVDDPQALKLAKGQQNGPLRLVRSTGTAIDVPISAGADSAADADPTSDTETAEGTDR